MGDVTEISVWQETTGGRGAVTAAPSTRGSLSSRVADFGDLEPVNRSEFAAEVVPCLSLTSGVSMSAEDQRTWLEAAFKALAGIPIALLQRGAAAAMRKADHPSKIVPAIMAEIGETWDRRRSHGAARPAALPSPSAPGETVAPDETQAILRRVWPTMGQHQRASAHEPHRPAPVTGGSDRLGRAPTRADYLRMGVSAETLDGMGITDAPAA